MRQAYFPRTGGNLKRSVSDEKFILTVRVTPNSSTNMVSTGSEGKVLIRLTSPPVDGEANKALIKFVAKKLKIRQSDVSIARGERSRDKTLLIRGVSREMAEQCLLS
ncbi:MAG: DUF167 domain-containing protein [Desulfomonilaceae bacterium]